MFPHMEAYQQEDFLDYEMDKAGIEEAKHLNPAQGATQVQVTIFKRNTGRSEASQEYL